MDLRGPAAERAQHVHAFHYKHSAVFKCPALKSFHDIISCQYRKPDALIQELKAGQQNRLSAHNFTMNSAFQILFLLDFNVKHPFDWEMSINNHFAQME